MMMNVCRSIRPCLRRPFCPPEPPLHPCLLRSPPPLRPRATRHVASSPTPGIPQSSPEVNVPTVGTTEDTLRFLVQHVLELKKNVAGMDQTLAIMAVELHVASGAVTAVCAGGVGLLMWYLKGTIKASRKTDV